MGIDTLASLPVGEGTAGTNSANEPQGLPVVPIAPSAFQLGAGEPETAKGGSLRRPTSGRRPGGACPPTSTGRPLPFVVAAAGNRVPAASYSARDTICQPCRDLPASAKALYPGD